MSLLAALLVFGLIILFHEFGHFLLAKRGGICVVEFSLGMGPRIFSFVKGGTRYSLKLLPFGGSCMMLGEDEEPEEEGERADGESRDAIESREEKAAGGSQSAGGLQEETPAGKSRGGTVLPEEMAAGKSRGSAGLQEETPAGRRPAAAALPEGEGAGNCLPASYAGLALPPGAKGAFFNETSVWTRFSVIAAGPVFNFILALLCAFFVISYVGYDPAEIHQVEPGYPAAEAGMEPGDVITKINGKRIRIYRDILSYTALHQGETLEVSYERDGEERTAVLEPRFSEESGSYLMGISGGAYRRAESVFTAARYSVYELRYWVDLTFQSLGMIVKRQVSADDIAGPVRIVSMIDGTVKESSSYGLMVVLVSLANMCVLLSANLGIMNLLPIPALDGGRLVFILLEMVRGKPIDREKEGMIHMAGMALLMTLMVFILFNDLRNIF